MVLTRLVIARSISLCLVRSSSWSGWSPSSVVRRCFGSTTCALLMPGFTVCWISAFSLVSVLQEGCQRVLMHIHWAALWPNLIIFSVLVDGNVARCSLEYLVLHEWDICVVGHAAWEEVLVLTLSAGVTGRCGRVTNFYLSLEADSFAPGPSWQAFW